MACNLADQLNTQRNTLSLYGGSINDLVAEVKCLAQRVATLEGSEGVAAEEGEPPIVVGDLWESIHSGCIVEIVYINPLDQIGATIVARPRWSKSLGEGIWRKTNCWREDFRPLPECERQAVKCEICKREADNEQ